MTQPPISEQITFLYAQNLAETAHFYEQVLGFELALDQGACRIYHTLDRRAYVGICEREVPAETGLIFTLVTPDVDGWYAYLKERGAQPENEPRMNERYGIYHFFLRDPNGYLIEVQRFSAEPWDQSR